MRKAPKPSEGQMDTCSIIVHTAVDAGDRALLRTKPKEKLDELLALKARFTMHKWKKDGSAYLPLKNSRGPQPCHMVHCVWQLLASSEAPRRVPRWPAKCFECCSTQ